MRSNKNSGPPKWPRKLLRICLKDEYLEEIEGDMEEIFHENKERYSEAKAKRMYTWDMLRLLRPGLIKNINAIHYNNPYPMFKNYIKVSLRSLMRNPLSSFINVFGLAVAIGICLVVYAFLAYDYSIDRFHEHKDELYLITYWDEKDGTLQQYGTSPRPLAEVLRQDYPQIKNTCRIEDGNVVVKQGEHVFHEIVRFADPAFLDMFSFPLKWGTTQTLRDLNSVILSDEMSTKYFGTINPVGKDILIKFDDETSKIFKVSGVASPFPDAHIIDFNFLINFDNLAAAYPGYDLSDWSQFIKATFIQVEDPSSLAQIEGGMEKYKLLQNDAQEDWAISSFGFEQLTTLHLRSRDILNGISYDYSKEGRVSLPIIALFMLALACFNYINIAIVSATRRLKEIGVRKVIGASRLRVITQFLTENIFTTSFALVMGVGLAVTVFLPWFIDIARVPMSIDLVDAKLWMFLVALALLTGIMSGLYPAFYISSFQTTKIFKGKVKFGQKNPLTKLFLGFQLVLTCILITGAVIYAQNTAFLANRSWGYEQDKAIYASVENESSYEQLRAVMERNKNVTSVSGSSHHLGKDVATSVIQLPPDKKVEVRQLKVDADYFKTMGLTLSSGRTFYEDAETDKQKVVVNQHLVDNLLLDQPLGYQFRIDSVTFEIIGVINDFHIYSFYDKMRPTIFTVADKAEFRYLSLRVEPGTKKETYDSLREQWATLFPETPFQGGYQEDVWSWFYEDLDTQVEFTATIAVIAVMLASLGLYGLVTLNVSGRIKEFSVRKVLGAGLHSITALITRQYIFLTIIALIIGAPLSYILVEANLRMLYPDPMPMGISGVAIAVIILLLVLTAVVSTQVTRIFKFNPVDGLKEE